METRHQYEHKPTAFAGSRPQGEERGLQVQVTTNVHAQRSRFGQTNVSSCLSGHCQPALRCAPGAGVTAWANIPALRIFEQCKTTQMRKTLYFLVPPATNWTSLPQFSSPGFGWFNNAPEFEHRRPSLSLTCTQSVSKARNYSRLGLEQPTWCQFYMFYKATACRKQLKCRSYQACDPQSNQRLPETVIQGSIIFLQEKMKHLWPRELCIA